MHGTRVSPYLETLKQMRREGRCLHSIGCGEPQCPWRPSSAVTESLGSGRVRADQCDRGPGRGQASAAEVWDDHDRRPDSWFLDHQAGEDVKSLASEGRAQPKVVVADVRADDPNRWSGSLARLSLRHIIGEPVR